MAHSYDYIVDISGRLENNYVITVKIIAFYSFIKQLLSSTSAQRVSSLQEANDYCASDRVLIDKQLSSLRSITTIFTFSTHDGLHNTKRFL